MRFKDAKIASKQGLGLDAIFEIMALGNFYSLRKMAAIEGEIDDVTSSSILASASGAPISSVHLAFQRPTTSSSDTTVQST